MPIAEACDALFHVMLRLDPGVACRHAVVLHTKHNARANHPPVRLRMAISRVNLSGGWYRDVYCSFDTSEDRHHNVGRLMRDLASGAAGLTTGPIPD